MANLNNIIYMSNADYNTMITEGSVIISGVTYIYDANNVYITPEEEATSLKAGLMSASDKTKLDGIERVAQVNILESVSVDGTAKTITSKNVNLTLSDFGITSTAQELNYTDGVTSNIQTQLDGKEAADATILKQADVVDNLTSTSTTAPLSANQGKELKTLIDNLPAPMVFKGTVGVGGTVSDLPTTGVKIGDTYKVITAGTYAGQDAKVGDMFIATAITPTWAHIPSGDEPSGTVTNVATGAGLIGGPITTTGTISVDFDSVQTKLTAGTGIAITKVGDDTVISNTQTSAEWGNIVGTLSDQTDLQSALDDKQDVLTAGAGISISSNTVSNTYSPCYYEQVGQFIPD